MKKFLYLDIDDVIVVGDEYWKRKTNIWDATPFNKKCVKVLNEILKRTGASIVVSSDWKTHYTLQELEGIFKFNEVKSVPIGTTPDLGFRTLQDLEKDRCKEICKHVEEHKPDKWVAIDDLDLSELGDDHFVHLPRWTEGIKQTGKKEKIILRLNEL